MNELDFAAANARHAGIGQVELKLGYLRSAGDGSDSERLRGAARELETYFIHLLIREMRKTIPENSVLSGGKAEEIFQDFLDEEIAGELARSNKLGLADMIFQDIAKFLKQDDEVADNNL